LQFLQKTYLHFTSINRKKIKCQVRKKDQQSDALAAKKIKQKGKQNTTITTVQGGPKNGYPVLFWG